MATIQLATLREITEGELSKIRKVGNIVSIYDVICAVTGQSLATCRSTWKRLIEMHPECVAFCHAYNFTKRGRGSHVAPGTDAEGITQIFMVLPGSAAAELRKNCAKVVVR